MASLKDRIRAEPEWQRVATTLQALATLGKYVVNDDLIDVINTVIRTTKRSTPKRKERRDELRELLVKADEHYKQIEDAANSIIALKLPKQITAASVAAWEKVVGRCNKAREKIAVRLDELTKGGRDTSPESTAAIIIRDYISESVSGKLSRKAVAKLCAQLLFPDLAGTALTKKQNSLEQALRNAE